MTFTAPMWLLPAIAAFLLAQVPLLIMLVRPWVQKLTPERRQAILGAVKGARDVLSVVAPLTATELDDHVRDALIVVEADLGKMSAEDKRVATNQIVSLAAKDAKGDAAIAAKAHSIIVGKE